MLEGKKIGVVIPAAGSGSRMGGSRPKQFLELDGKPIVVRTLEVFESSLIVDAIVVTALSEEIENVKKLVRENKLTKVVSVTSGGERRQDSVWNGLKELRGQSIDVVLVHDAVRPFVTDDLIVRMTKSALQHRAAIPAIRPKDTIKSATANGFIDQTLDREKLYQIQTPQGFTMDVLVEAFEKANAEGFNSTDEASLVERCGIRVKIVEGSYENMKITTPEDIEVARVIMNRMGIYHKDS